ncbi:MAG: phage head closure protein [Xanthobacteraceae bacterium]|nr:phage head closure protein [Xanthobacteraceae bacterium]
MRAGKLDQQIVVQRFTNTVDDYGTPIETWTTLATVRAQIIQQSTEEFIRGYGASDDAIVIFRVRWIPDISTADRVVFDGDNYNIKELKPIGRAKGVDIRAVMQ